MKGSNIFKGLLTFIFLLFAAMLYWSSLLQESDLKKIRLELKELRSETALLNQKLARELQHSSRIEQEKREHYHSSLYPNLLIEDPFFKETLPALIGENFRPKGMLKRALIGRPENLHPFNGFRDVSEMIHLCSVSLADLKTGCYETMAPQMAVRFEERPYLENSEIPEYWIFLRDDVFWEPLNKSHFPENLDLAPQFLEKHSVTAHDFKFFYDAVMNPYIYDGKAAALKTYYNDIEEIRVVNDTTLVVRWKSYPAIDEEGHSAQKIKYTAKSLTGSLQPLPRFIYQFFADGQKIVENDSEADTYKNNSVWAQNFSHHWAKNVIVSCGPYLFDGMTDEGISFRRNPHYFNPYTVLIEGIRYSFKESFDAVWQDFKTGKLDMCTLSPNQLIELNNFLKSEDYHLQASKGMSVQTLDYTDLSFYYIGWNQSKPFFADERVRRALTLAIDRGRIIEQNLNLMAVAISGPFCRSSTAYDNAIAPYPYHPEEACQLLEEAGWIDIDGDGIRDKIIDGKLIPFRFKLYYFVKSNGTKVIAEYITTTLRSIGVHCELCGVDIADLSRHFEDKTFDAIYMGWKQGTPPEDPRQLWHSSGAREKGSSNAIGFANAEIDQLIEQLSYEYDKNKRTSLYHKFHQIIHKEAPYTFLYTPKVKLVYRNRVKNMFIPADRQDLIPNADIPEPYTNAIWLDSDS
jgi:peptide/nickel transport system substrate-binding protein